MQRFKHPKVLFGFLLVAAIVIGVAWGLKIKRAADVRRVPEADASVLKVLALKNAFPTKFVKAFEAYANIKIELTEVSAPDLLAAKLEGTEKYDLVTLLSSQTSLAAAAMKIQPLKLTDLVGADQVSPDFVDLPGEAQRPSVVPLSWGLAGIVKPKSGEPVSWAALFEKRPEGGIELKPSHLSLAILADETANGKENDLQFITRAQRIQKATTRAPDFFRQADATSGGENAKGTPENAKDTPDETLKIRQIHHGESAFAPFNSDELEFQIPEEGAELWVLSLSLAASAENLAGADRFIEYLLKPANAAELARQSHQASCNRAVESDSKLDRKLKPSYLREIPLEKIKVPNASLVARSKLLKDL